MAGHTFYENWTYICPVLVKSVSTHKIISFLKLLFINPKNPTYFGTKITSSVRVLERNMFSMLLDSHTSQAAVKTSEIWSHILLPQVLYQYVCILKREFYKCFVCKIYVYMWCQADHPVIRVVPACGFVAVLGNSMLTCLGRAASKVYHLFLDITLPGGAMTSCVMSRLCMCISHMIICYKRLALLA